MYFAILALGGISLQSCDKDDNLSNADLPVALQQAFAEKYPNATRIEWEMKGSYYEAEFTQDNVPASAWFTPDGGWEMTEMDIRYEALPAIVQTAFKSSKYAQWRVDDVDQLERKGMEMVYVLDVESGNQEVDLYYSKDGILIKAVNDIDDDDVHTPPMTPPVSSVVTAFIKEKYPNARIIETEVERGITEVDIIHDNIGKEVKFGSTNVWISTSWEIRTLPAPVTNAIQEKYGTYRVDDADFFETPAGNYYLVELEKNGAPDVVVKVNANGEFLNLL